MKNIFFLLISAGMLVSSAYAQTPWPAVQSANYPMVQGMQLVRHEQSVLFGEAAQQTGLFFARLNQTYSERVQTQLIADAENKGWQLHTLLRHGTQYVLTFHKGFRLLDVRLSNTPESVNATYAISLNQQAIVTGPVAATASQATPQPASTPNPIK